MEDLLFTWTVLNALYTLSKLLLSKPLWTRWYCYSCFTEEQTGLEILNNLHKESHIERQNQVSNPGLPDTRVSILNH